MTDQTPTTSQADTTLDEQTAIDVAQLAQLTQEIKERKEAADEIKIRLRGVGGGTWWHNGRQVLNIGDPSSQFDPKLAATAIPVELHAACSVLKLDGPTAKRVLPADLYAKCCTPKAAAVKTL